MLLLLTPIYLREAAAQTIVTHNENGVYSLSIGIDGLVNATPVPNSAYSNLIPESQSNLATPAQNEQTGTAAIAPLAQPTPQAEVNCDCSYPSAMPTPEAINAIPLPTPSVAGYDGDG
jgi:hypothetical protein